MAIGESGLARDVFLFSFSICQTVHYGKWRMKEGFGHCSDWLPESLLRPIVAKDIYSEHGQQGLRDRADLIED
jgi:hypothetical protein